MAVTVNFDVNKILGKINKAKEHTTEILTNEVLKDTNVYVPADEWKTRDSSLSASDFKKGIIRYNTPYAKRLYYDASLNISKKPNPNARGLWFEEAKSINKEKWNRIAKKLFREAYK